MTMDDDAAHFAAYSFVDRIGRFEPGRGARASFAIPAGLDAFSSCLVAEAIGQLAAWVAMDHIDFRGRPVAALATETRFHGNARPGEVLDLEVTILECDDDAVAYNGRATVGGRAIVDLIDCLGPMLPVADFDAPEALRARLALLRDGGAVPGRFHGIDPLPVTLTGGVTGVSRQATLAVPPAATFFGDHFPRRAVFPATLLLDAALELALDGAAGAPALRGAAPRLLEVTHVKMRSFIEPGQELDLEIGIDAPERTAAETGGARPGTGEASLRARFSARTAGRLVATARIGIGASR